MARPCPMMRGSRTVPRSHSGTPKRRQNTPKIASSAATRRSHQQRQLDAAGDGITLDGGDHGLGQGQSGRPHGPGPMVGDGPPVSLGDRLEVGPGAEGAAGAGQDGHRAVVIAVEGLEGLAQPVGADAVDRVAAFGPVDRDHGHRAVVLDEQGIAPAGRVGRRGGLGRRLLWTHEGILARRDGQLAQAHFAPGQVGDPFRGVGPGARKYDQTCRQLPGQPVRSHSANTDLTSSGGHMAVRLGDTAPDFTADTTDGTINFHEWLGDSWGILFSHPKDFTPVCTTELGAFSKAKPEFDKRNAKLIGLSVDSVESHKSWAGDIEETQGSALAFPLIGDEDRKVADLYDMIHPNANDTLTVRSVFIIGPDKKVKLTLTYPASTGRNVDEILRVLDSLQLTADYKVATPVNWTEGEDVIIVPAVSDDEAKDRFPKGWKALKPYLRVTPQPNR